MIDAFHSLSDWVVAFADSDWAILVLAVEAFAESIFFPIPPDPLLVLVALLQQHLAIWLAIMVTIASVAGAVVGHWLGGKLGRPLLDRWFSKRIATRLHISTKTVEAHRRNMMRKLDLHSIAELTRYAVREGLTSLD